MYETKINCIAKKMSSLIGMLLKYFKHEIHVSLYIQCIETFILKNGNYSRKTHFQVLIANN